MRTATLDRIMRVAREAGGVTSDFLPGHSAPVLISGGNSDGTECSSFGALKNLREAYTVMADRQLPT